MINAIIVEDELIQIVYLQNLLSEFCPGVKVIASIHSESEVVPQLTNRCFDLLFLDVKLGKSNAFELLEQLPKIDFHIIFISAFDEYAYRAIKTNAVDYLLKPFNGNELMQAVGKAMERIKNREALPGRSGAGSASHDSCLCISEQDAYTFIPCRDILFCRSEGNYTQLHFINEVGKTEIILATKNLLHFEQKLCFDNFIRIHQSVLVNRSKIRKIKKGTRELILSDGTAHEIARDRKSAVLALLIQ